jgi:hypothetical protein
MGIREVVIVDDVAEAVDPFGEGGSMLVSEGLGTAVSFELKAFIVSVLKGLADGGDPCREGSSSEDRTANPQTS